MDNKEEDKQKAKKNQGNWVVGKIRNNKNYFPNLLI